MSQPGLHKTAFLGYTGKVSNEQNGQAMVRVLVLSDESVLSFGVERLLRREATLEIVACVATADEALGRIQTLQPNVVILTPARQQGESTLAWLRILRDMPGIRLITLDLQDSAIGIYQGMTQPVQDVADLLDAIRAPLA
jgi:DNA-binding NarL/FixJ family response regulator